MVLRKPHKAKNTFLEDKGSAAVFPSVFHSPAGAPSKVPHVSRNGKKLEGKARQREGVDVAAVLSSSSSLKKGPPCLGLTQRFVLMNNITAER